MGLPANIKAYKESSHAELVKVAGGEEKYVVQAWRAFENNPKLWNCPPDSIKGSIFEASQLRLNIGLHNHGWLVPFKGQCTFMLGYGGLIELMKRNGEVYKVTAEIVCERDEYHADSEDVYHRFDPFSEERGEIVGAYARAKLANGEIQYAALPKSKIDGIAKRGGGKGGGPWKTDWEEMAKKTCVRRLSKLVRMGDEEALGIRRDDERFGIQKTIEVTPHRRSGNDEALALLEDFEHGDADARAPSPSVAGGDGGPQCDYDGLSPGQAAEIREAYAADRDPEPVRAIPVGKPKKRTTKKVKTANRPIRDPEGEGALFDGASGPDPFDSADPSGDQ